MSLLSRLPLNRSSAAPGAGQRPRDAIAVPAASPHAVVFEEIVEKYHGKVFQLVYRYTGDYEEACDLTQDTFVRAFGAWNEFRGESQIYTWLYRIAINLCHNQQKKLGRRRRVEQPLEVSSEAGEEPVNWSCHHAADDRPLPGQLLERGELREHLKRALQDLPDNYRTVIVLRDIEGLSYDEIARVTDSSLEAIKSRLFRARGAMRRLLEPYLSENDALPASALRPRERRSDKTPDKAPAVMTAPLASPLPTPAQHSKTT